MGKEEQGIDQQRYTVIPRTLILLFDGEDVLLLKGAKNKKRWAGKYNGLGGHIERGEDVLTSAKRELQEESGLTDIQLYLCGTIICDVEAFLGVSIFVYKGSIQKVALQPSEEGQLEWINTANLETLNIVEDMQAIIPHVHHWKVGDTLFSATNAYDEEERLVTTFYS